MRNASFVGARAALDPDRSLCWLALSVTVEDVPCSVACRMAPVRRKRSSVVASGVAVALAPEVIGIAGTAMDRSHASTLSGPMQSITNHVLFPDVASLGQPGRLVWLIDY